MLNSEIALSTSIEATRAKERSRRWQHIRKSIRRDWQLYVLLLPPVAYLIIFRYWPMWGVQIAFREFNAAEGISGSPWVGWKQFDRFVSSYQFWPVLKNTLILNGYQLLAGFPLPILLALSLNYVRQAWFKKSVQLISYAPHFISTVVMAGIILQFLQSGQTLGVVNLLLREVGIDPINWMGEPAYWKSIYVWTGVWQTVGFSCIIYLAALAGIDPTLHEAAIVDGATKLQRIRDVDIPGILPVAIILLILNMGALLDTGFEKVLLLQNGLNLGTSEVLDSYVYRVAFASPLPQYSLAAAIGLFKGVIGLVLIVTANQLAKRLRGTSLW
jgi:multiple sugar transport system permease protein/putative aldouronate transport system permease protein